MIINQQYIGTTTKALSAIYPNSQERNMLGSIFTQLLGPLASKKLANTCNYFSFDAGAIVYKGASFTNA